MYIGCQIRKCNPKIVFLFLNKTHVVDTQQNRTTMNRLNENIGFKSSDTFFDYLHLNLVNFIVMSLTPQFQYELELMALTFQLCHKQ